MREKGTKKAVVSTATGNDKQIALLRWGCVPDRSPATQQVQARIFMRLELSTSFSSLMRQI